MTDPAYHLSTGEPPGSGQGLPGSPRTAPDPAEDLAYRVEVWPKDEPSRLVALVSTVSLGYAVFYAAGREHPGCEVTLRHRGALISHWKS